MNLVSFVIFVANWCSWSSLTSNKLISAPVTTLYEIARDGKGGDRLHKFFSEFRKLMPQRKDVIFRSDSTRNQLTNRHDGGGGV